MGISSINDYSGLLQNYRVPVIPSVSVDRVREQERLNTETQDVVTAPSHEIQQVEKPVRKDAELEDISIIFNKKDDFSYIGRDKDIQALDVEKALYDMRKDKILQQYQYFVGSARSASAMADGTVKKVFW